MVEGGLRPFTLAGRRLRDDIECVCVEVLPHVLAGDIPDCEQHALTLVVAGTVLVGLAEITDRDGAVNGRDDVGHLDVCRGLREDVAATDTALRTHESGALQGEKYLLEVGLGQAGSFRDVTNGRRSGLGGMQSQGQQRPARIITSRGHSHGDIVGAGL